MNLFYNIRVQSHIKQSYIMCRTVATAIWDKLPAVISPAVRGMLYKARVRREQAVGARLSNTAQVY